jgi:hypothetical protein
MGQLIYIVHVFVTSIPDGGQIDDPSFLVPVHIRCGARVAQAI